MSKKLLTRTQIGDLLGKQLKRSELIEGADLVVDREARTVEMSFSSDAPIDHWFGKLILNHAPACVRLERLRSGGAFLLDHDRSRQVGVHESVTTDGHRLRGTVRFSRGALGEETLQDVEDGIRRNTSVGLLLHELHFVRETEEDGPVYQSDDWEPVENSLVSVPADISVGVGRALDADDEAAAEDRRERREEVCACEGAGCDECRDEAGRNEDSGAEEERATQPTTGARSKAVDEKDIIEFGRLYGEEDLARTMALEGKTIDDVRGAIKAKRAAAAPPAQVPPVDAATAASRQGGTQLARTSSRVHLKAFKGEGADERALRAGHFLRAALFGIDSSRDFCREHGVPVQRAQSESDNESGGFLVPAEFENVMIDLRLEYGVFRRNANVVPMAGLRKERPRRKGGLTAYPIGARGANRRLTESKKNWDLVGLDAKKWGVLAKYEDELSEDSVIAMADDLTSEIAYAFTSVEDECGFLADGTSDYHGIVGVIPKLTGLSGTVAHVAGLQEATGNLWSEIELIDILGMVGKLPSFARKTGQVKWYCSNEFWATVLVRLAFELGGNALGQIQNEVQPTFLGKPVEIVEVMPHTEANSQVPLLYGNLAQAAMFGDRRGVTVKMTDSNDTDFEEDLMAIKGTERFDINVHDVGNADAAAANRKAGPVVGLITKAS